MAIGYNRTHEWARLEGDEAVIGLSAFAAGEVGEVIHVELPQVGATVRRGESCAEIESVKSVNDFYSPVDGEVIAINDALTESPELVNSEPAGAGWFLRVRVDEATALDGLLDEAAYQTHIQG